jgi:sterol desaturase/sphingolipid hydroxylase (fatty acid hydroxylase superfamily)
MSYFLHFLTIPLAIIYSHVSEWLIHKYILHGLGKNRKSIWSFHWHAHHKKCRKYNNYDEDYLDDWLGAPLREKIGLFTLVLVHLPLLMYVPLFFITLTLCAIKYYKVHKYAHLNPCWGKTFLRWHYDHHMGKDQDANWGVTTDWVDRLLKTRKKYYEIN